MKFPRDISGNDLIHRLKKLGYAVTRHTGDHARLTTYEHGEHHITVPLHDSLRIGTVHNILSEIANHFHLTKKDLIQVLFD